MKFNPVRIHSHILLIYFTLIEKKNEKNLSDNNDDEKQSKQRKRIYAGERNNPKEMTLPAQNKTK